MQLQQTKNTGKYNKYKKLKVGMTENIVLREQEWGIIN